LMMGLFRRTLTQSLCSFNTRVMHAHMQDLNASTACARCWSAPCTVTALGHSRSAVLFSGCISAQLCCMMGPGQAWLLLLLLWLGVHVSAPTALAVV
jgi:Fe-S-cluster-containing hydrogenase component 2